MTKIPQEPKHKDEKKDHRKNHRKDRGVATIEAALIAMIFFLSIFSIFEFGTFMRDYLTAHEGVSAGSREGAAFGAKTTRDSMNGDMAAIQAIRATTGVLPAQYVDRIVIWKADPNKLEIKTPPELCVDKTITVDTEIDQVVNGVRIRCNIYAEKISGNIATGNAEPIYRSSLKALFEMQSGNVDYFTCPTPATNVAPCGWPVDDRQDRIGVNQPSLDYFGLYVEVTHPWATSFFGEGGINFETYAIRRLEASPAAPAQ